MTTNSPLSLACACGQVKARVTVPEPAKLSRYVCHCDDCQAFARHLGQTDRILDENGGTEVVHLYPSQLHIEQGSTLLGCLHLEAPKAMRWFSSCCNTPLFNTPPSPGLPFVSALSANLSDSSRAQLGPVIGHVHIGFAYGDTSGLADKHFEEKKVIGKVIRGMLFERLMGRHRKTPLFDTSGSPITKPVFLSEAERSKAYARDQGSNVN